jgi:hypothetical protein
MKAMSLWNNFYIGIMMAVTGVRDCVFLRESLLNLSTIRHPEVESKREWLQEIVHLGSTRRIAILLQEPPDHIAVWNWYLPLLVYPRLTEKGISEHDGSTEDVEHADQPGDTQVVALDTLLV